MLESRRLKHFLAVYELGSIGQAAEKLLLTQPALSKSLRSLEDALGVRLFERTTLGVVPTVFGKALALHAKAIHTQVRHAEAQIAGLRGNATGQVTIGIGPSIAERMMPLATDIIRKRGIDIDLVVTEGLVDGLIPSLRRGEIDLAVGSWPRVAEPSFSAETIATDELRVFATRAHPLAGRKVELSELLAHRWAQPPSSQRWRQQFEECFFERGLPAPKAEVVTNSATYLKTLICEQGFLSFLPELLLSDSEYVAIDTDLADFSVEITLTYKDRTMHNGGCVAVAEAFREAGSALSSRRVGAQLLTRAA